MRRGVLLTSDECSAARDAAKNPTMYRIAPFKTITWPKISTVSLLRNVPLTPFFLTKQQFTVSLTLNPNKHSSHQPKIRTKLKAKRRSKVCRWSPRTTDSFIHSTNDGSTVKLQSDTVPGIEDTMVLRQDLSFYLAYVLVILRLKK